MGKCAHFGRISLFHLACCPGMTEPMPRLKCAQNERISAAFVQGVMLTMEWR